MRDLRACTRFSRLRLSWANKLPMHAHAQLICASLLQQTRTRSSPLPLSLFPWVVRDGCDGKRGGGAGGSRVHTAQARVWFVVRLGGCRDGDVIKRHKGTEMMREKRRSKREEAKRGKKQSQGKQCSATQQRTARQAAQSRQIDLHSRASRTPRVGSQSLIDGC